MRTKTIAIILTIVTIISLIPCAVSASENKEFPPLKWDNTGMVTCMIGFPGDDYGYAEAHVMGHPSATQITADVYVYRQIGSSWYYVGEAHKTVYGNALSISYQFPQLSGVYYRADYTFIVTKGGNNETINQTKYKTSP